MQKLDSLSDFSLNPSSKKLTSFCSTKLKLRQRYLSSFFKDEEKSVSKRNTSDQSATKEVLFEEIKSLLEDF